MDNRAIDRKVYEEELAPWLPPRIIDCHVHVGLPEHCRPPSPDRLQANWAMEVGAEQSWERLREVSRVLFPRQEVGALVFGVPFREVDLEKSNDYVLSGAADPANKSRGLFITRPEWSVEAIENAFERGFVGIKPYPDLAPESAAGPSIYDFVPRSHLAALDGLGGILMLHLPRRGRLADPDNIREILEISDRHPRIRLIVAHIGRAFCLPAAERGLPHFADRPGVYFDTSANLNADVFHLALQTVGPERILYGSDLPITLMHGMREHVGESYINYTDGDYSWNTNRKSPEEEASYTYFLYEELRAIIEAVRRVGLGRDAVEKILYSNSAGLIEGCG